jgi:hypothetical protein
MVTARMWVAAGFGGPEVLRNIEADVPDPGPGQVTLGERLKRRPRPGGPRRGRVPAQQPEDLGDQGGVRRALSRGTV